MDAASIRGASSTSKIGKLLPKKLRRLKHHQSGESLDSRTSSEDGPRGMSLDSRNGNLAAGTGPNKASFSTSHGSEPSLIGDDSDDLDRDEAEAALSPMDYEEYDTT